MRILCIFLPHKWIHIMNVEGIGGFISIGLYQCRRCKEISKGSPRQFVSAEDRKKRYEKGICDDVVDKKP